MRFVMWHVDSFRSTITEKGRAKFIEEPLEKETYIEDALIVFTSVEKSDSKNPEKVARKAADTIAEHATNLKVKNIVVHPYAHLFADLGAPSVAVEVMDKTNEFLQMNELNSVRTPFGWFNKLEIFAKGHPMSRIAKTINCDR